MKKNNPISVSVGIPAFNEGATIRTVILEVLSQIESKWYLKEILVYCDGCWDNTASEANSLHDPRVRVIDNKDRQGKTYRLQQMFQEFSGDMLIVVDADIHLEGRNVFSELVKTASQYDKIGLVSGNVRPFPPKTFFQNAVYSTFSVFDKTRKSIRNGENIFTCGALLCLKKDFAKKINFPKIFNEDAFIYLSCISMGFEFRHNHNAVLYYKMPLTLHDHLRQAFRSDSEAVSIELRKHFPKIIDQELHRPTALYARAVINTFFENPLGTAIMILIRVICYPLFPIITKRYKLSWFTAKSTHI